MRIKNALIAALSLTAMLSMSACAPSAPNNEGTGFIPAPVTTIEDAIAEHGISQVEEAQALVETAVAASATVPFRDTYQPGSGTSAAEADIYQLESYEVLHAYVTDSLWDGLDHELDTKVTELDGMEAAPYYYYPTTSIASGLALNSTDLTKIFVQETGNPAQDLADSKNVSELMVEVLPESQQVSLNGNGDIFITAQTLTTWQHTSPAGAVSTGRAYRELGFRFNNPTDGSPLRFGNVYVISHATTKYESVTLETLIASAKKPEYFDNHAAMISQNDADFDSPPIM